MLRVRWGFAWGLGRVVVEVRWQSVLGCEDGVGSSSFWLELVGHTGNAAAQGVEDQVCGEGPEEGAGKVGDTAREAGPWCNGGVGVVHGVGHPNALGVVPCFTVITGNAALV